MEIRNIAIIAHVDHGKTAITDALMRQTGATTNESVSMDSNVLEKERGITIYAKNASMFHKDTKINIVDSDQLTLLFLLLMHKKVLCHRRNLF